MLAKELATQRANLDEHGFEIINDIYSEKEMEELVSLINQADKPAKGV